jgi:hypothetical protein
MRQQPVDLLDGVARRQPLSNGQPLSDSSHPEAGGMQHSIDPIGQRGQALHLDLAAEDLVPEPCEFLSSKLSVLFAASFLHTLSPAGRVSPSAPQGFLHTFGFLWN